MRGFFFGLGCVLAAALLYGASAPRPGCGPGTRADGPSAALRGPGGGPVLVFHLGDVASVATVRAAVSSERVVAESAAAFALREGRIVSAGHDATAALLTETGWSDRPLEIHRAEPRDPRRPDRPGGAGPDAAPSLEALAGKPYLTPAEALAVLDQLE